MTFVCCVPPTHPCVYFVFNFRISSLSRLLFINCISYLFKLVVDTMFGSTVILIVVVLDVCCNATFLTILSLYFLSSTNFHLDERGRHNLPILIAQEASFIMHSNCFLKNCNLMIINHFLFLFPSFQFWLLKIYVCTYK